jgi:tRNA modification GTPase
VRVSGPAVRIIAAELLGAVPAPRRAHYEAFRDHDGAALDHGIALFFPAPHSFTGEDILELHGHGGPVVLDMVLARACALGARPARPGEFSERAFLNDKLDLVQAEAVADLIDSASQQAARSALRSLEGEFSAHLNALSEALIHLRMQVEAAIDFPEEEIDFLSDGRIAAHLEAVSADLRDVMAEAQQGRLLREGMTVVIAGPPNAGKSSLLNRLARRETAIVTEIPGTTRDLLREHIHLQGLPLHIIDTAGLRDSTEPVERQGIERAWAEIARADRVLLVIDDQHGLDEAAQRIMAQMPAAVPRTVVHNKIDLSGRPAGPWREGDIDRIGLSAKEGIGLEDLRRHLINAMGCPPGGEGGFMARRRHLEALQTVAAALTRGGEVLHRDHAGELLAEELRSAHQALGEITGEFSTEDLLGKIFSQFCIGK